MTLVLYRELESKTVPELLDAFDGPPLDGEEYRAVFYDDVAQRIADLGGSEQLRDKLDTDDDDRLAALLGGLSSRQAAIVDRVERQAEFRRGLVHHYPSVVVAAIDGLRSINDLDVRGQVFDLIVTAPPIVSAAGLGYMRAMFEQEAAPLLLAALDDPDPIVWFAAVNELDDLDGFADRATFERMLDDPDPDVSAVARCIVGHHVDPS
jgi:hypothetical protein